MENIDKKQLLFFIAPALVLVLIVVGFAIFLLLPRREGAPQEEFPLPTPFNEYTRSTDGSFRFTPYQQTEIGKTTDQQIQNNLTILDKTATSTGETIYKIPSAVPTYQDEIRTKNGVVVFEKTRTFVKDNIPKLASYRLRYGEPEIVIEGVQPWGYRIDAYIYASQGFTLIVNPNTESNYVYEVQRFIPMSVEEYKKQYADLVLKAEPAVERPY